MQKSILALLGMSSGVFAAAENNHCAPEPPATCYRDDCKHCYCLGPENIIANAPARPVTCNGDWMITLAGFYWESHQDGMEYAIENNVAAPSSGSLTPGAANDLNNLIDAKYQTPDFDWDWGFKLGLGYNTTCDGWDFGVVWTWYRGKAHDHIEAEHDDNSSLLPLWSAFDSSIGGILFVTDIETNWNLEMNLVDIELGREYWVSKRMTTRPFVGLRVAFLDQEFEIHHKGGSFSENAIPYPQNAFNNDVDIDNDFKGVGVRGGLDSVFHLGCGWGIYGNLAGSIVYGRFSVDHDESNRLAITPHTKVKILETKEHFRVSRAMLDLGLGVQWSSLFCDCQYGITVSLGWEQHMFFHQNQMWRVNRIGDIGGLIPPPPSPTTTASSSLLPSNDDGENDYYQRRGTLDTQGVTLKVVFEF